MSELIKQYIKYCKDQNMLNSNPRLANDAYKKRHQIFKELKRLDRLSELGILLLTQQENLRFSKLLHDIPHKM